MQGGQLTATQNRFILLYLESHLNQGVEHFQGILHKLWRMKRIKGMHCTTQADIRPAWGTRWFLMETFAKTKNKNEKRIIDDIY